MQTTLFFFHHNHIDQQFKKPTRVKILVNFHTSFMHHIRLPLMLGSLTQKAPTDIKPLLLLREWKHGTNAWIGKKKKKNDNQLQNTKTHCIDRLLSHCDCWGSPSGSVQEHRGREPERSGVKALRHPWMVACVRDMASWHTPVLKNAPSVSAVIYQRDGKLSERPRPRRSMLPLT